MPDQAPSMPPLPAPDTHCHDEDTGRDVWSHSAGQMHAYAQAVADERVRAALAGVAAKLRRAGAAIPAPCPDGTIDSAMVTGLSIALALVEFPTRSLGSQDST